MLITLLTAGSRGDTQPFVALGVALKEAGYRVRIAASETFTDLIESYGLEFHAVAGDVSGMASNRDIRAAMQADNPVKIVLSFNTLKAYAFALQQDYFAACQGSDAIVYHPGASIGYFAAQALGVPSILASPFPMTPTKSHPALVFYTMPRLGKQANILSHTLFEQIMWLTSSGPVKRFWKQTVGSLPKPFSSPFSKQQTASHPTLIACSNYVFPEPADYPEHVNHTGYWFLEQEATWQPSVELRTFLEEGPPPIYVGFGSLSDPPTASATTRSVVEALRLTNQRGILATGWNGMTRLDELPDTILMLDSVPHAWLFPKMAAVIHHGGAGTTAAGLRAGIPSVVIPHAVDQFAWGQRVYELGVGSKPIPKKELTADKLASAITYSLTGKIKLAAQALGQKIRSENGLVTATRIIERCLTKA